MATRDVRRVMDAICEAQRADGLVDVQLGTAFLLVGFYLSPDDLEQVRPCLEVNPDQPDVWLGRYRSVPVFPLKARGATECPCASFDGVWFEYVPMDVVD